MADKMLTPIEEKTVIFYEDEITAVMVQVNDVIEVYVPIRPLCDYLGVTWSPQLRRINRDPVLSKKIERVTVTVTDSYRTTGREMICLPLDYLNGWLFGINADRVAPEARDQVIRYQEECYRVLADAFIRPGRETAVSTPNPVLVQVRELGRAIMQMAEEQIEFERRLTTAETKLEIVTDLDERLTTVEKQLFPGDSVTQSQAMQVSQAVKAVAIALGKETKKNEFGGVYGELYRIFEITSYKLLPANKFEDAMTFLTEWHQRIVSNTEF